MHMPNISDLFLPIKRQNMVCLCKDLAHEPNQWVRVSPKLFSAGMEAFVLF